MKELPVLNWPALSREPIIRALLLSACLHLALAALIQPAPGSRRVRTVVIDARLEASQSKAEPSTPAAAASIPAGTPAGLPAAPPPEAPQPALLASDQPSPSALPIPVMPPVAAEAPHAATASVSSFSRNPSLAGSNAPSAGPATSAPLLPTLPLGIDTTWYMARQVDSHPRAMGRIEPAYPEEARRRNLEGTLKLMLKIDDLGRVQSAEVVEANPPGVFDEAALQAFRDARFQPAMKEGRPVRYQAYMRVDFKLED
jgi:protein TonB